MTIDRRSQVSGAADKAYGLIRAQLLSERWPPGTPLKEAELATEFGMSRTPVREALRRLAADGLAQFRANHGVSALQWSADDWEEIFDLRAMLESRAAGLAAKHRTTEEISALESLCARMETAARSGDRARSGLVELNAAFHRALVEASHSRQLIQLVRSLSHSMSIFRSYGNYSADEVTRSMVHHREIVAALRAGDSDWAASALRTHILAGKTKIRASAALQAPGA